MAKYDAVRKIQRNQAVLLLHRADPTLSLKEIGAVFDISKQRVSAIIKRATEMQSETGGDHGRPLITRGVTEPR